MQPLKAETTMTQALSCTYAPPTPRPSDFSYTGEAITSLVENTTLSNSCPPAKAGNNVLFIDSNQNYNQPISADKGGLNVSYDSPENDTQETPRPRSPQYNGGVALGFTNEDRFILTKASVQLTRLIDDFEGLNTRVTVLEQNNARVSQLELTNSRVASLEQSKWMVTGVTATISVLVTIIGLLFSYMALHGSAREVYPVAPMVQIPAQPAPTQPAH